MQSMPVSDTKPRSPGVRRIRIAIDIGQYHYVTWDGWKEQWQTMTAREWWKKQQWLKAGGWKQDEN